MRAVIQRVTQASVRVEGKIVGEIGDGLCILLGVGSGDTEADAEKLADRIVNLRIFEDGEGRMNLSLLETGGGVLIVSQFTLYGDCRKGRRPSFAQAAPAEEANRLYEYFMGQVRQRGVPVSCGIFRTHMLVELANDGPVTLILEA